MTKKEKFVQLVEMALSSMEVCPVQDGGMAEEDYNDALAYFNALKQTKEKEKPAFTENGKLILGFMQENWEKFNNLMKAKDIADGTFISSRSVSGSIRKLVNDGYVEKVGQDPINYSLTSLGKEVMISE